MKKKRIMILGARESGKTLLANYLNEIDTPPKRTPHMVYGRNTLDVPVLMWRVTICTSI